MSGENKILRDAKNDWLARFDGAVAERTVTIGSPTVRHIYKRAYDHIGRNCHYISVFGRVLLGEEKISEPEAAVAARLQEVTTSLERKIAASRATIVDAGIKEVANFNKPETINVKIISPVQKKFLNILTLADEYLRLINTLWLEGEIVDKAKSKAELELKQQLRIIASTTRKMQIYLRGKVQEAANETNASAETKRIAAQIKTDGDAASIDAGEDEDAPALAAAA